MRPEGAAGALVGAEEQRGDPVDLDAIVLLRHRPVARAQARLDVGDRDAGPGGRARACERGVRVAVDERPVRLCVGERGGDARRHRVDVACPGIEPEVGFAEAELVEEHLRQLAVVVLPGVEDEFVDPGLAQRHRERRRLDELRPVAHNRQDAHPSQPRDA